MTLSSIGGALIGLSAALAGLMRTRELRQRERAAGALLSALRLLESEICRLRRPLPEAVAQLARRGGSLFRGLGELPDSDEPEADRLCRAVRGLPLPGEGQALLCTLFSALAGGEQPERAFSFAVAEAERFCAQTRRDCDEKCRLFAALGICTGLMIAIALL